jgi:hypothetical protein
MRSLITLSIRRMLPAGALLLPLLALLVALAGPASGAHAATLGGMTLDPQPSSAALSITPATQTVWVARGGVYHFDLAVKNAGATDTTVYLGATTVSGWKVRLSQETALVKAQSSTMIGLDVAIPIATTVDGARIDVTAKNQTERATAAIKLLFGPTPYQ